MVPPCGAGIVGAVLPCIVESSAWVEQYSNQGTDGGSEQ
jgi:hypothetical protein